MNEGKGDHNQSPAKLVRQVATDEIEHDDLNISTVSVMIYLNEKRLTSSPRPCKSWKWLVPVPTCHTPGRTLSQMWIS